MKVSFKAGTAQEYAGLLEKDSGTFYLISDEDKVYLGEEELTISDEENSAISLVNDGLKGNEALYSKAANLAVWNSVDGPSSGMQDKTVTITKNKTTLITADSGYDGLNSVRVITNVSGGGGIDWSVIGYSSMPQSIQDRYDYAVQIKNNWVPSSSYNGKFRNDRMLTYMPLVDTSSGTNFSSMFYNCTALTTIPQLDTSSGTNFSDMFSNCYSLTTIPQLDTSSGVNFSSMFYYCYSLITIPLLDTSSVTNFSSMFYYCTALITIPLLDTSSGVDFISMFYNCTALTTIPLLNTSSGTRFISMFYNCRALTTIPQLDTSSGTNFSNMFYNCRALTTIPQLDTSSGVDFDQTFYNCTALTTIPQLDTSSGTIFSSMFYNCTALTTIPLLDTSRGVKFSSMFYNCTALTTLSGLKNIGQPYLTTQRANYSDYKLQLNTSNELTHDSLMNVINNLYDIATKGCKQQQLVLGSTNLAKLTQEEIAIATAKGWAVS